MILDKAAIIKAMKLKTETIKIDGGEVIISEVTALEYMDAYTSDLAKDEKGEFDGTKFTSLLATRCIVDAKGKRIFDDADAELIRNGSSSIYTKIIVKVKDLNGLGADAKN